MKAKDELNNKMLRVGLLPFCPRSSSPGVYQNTTPK